MQKNIMNDLYKTIVKLEQYISKIILFFIIGLTFIAAMSRAFNFPLPWSIDVILLLFCWFAFFAASQATRRKANLGVDIIVRHLPKTVQNIIDLINKLLITFFLICMGYSSLRLSITNVKRLITSLDISYSFITASLFVGCVLMTISEIIQIVERIQIMREKAEEENFKSVKTD
ncbi:TRAP transporter small permease [Treponema sp. OMZ 840]|uniref:TRAP transporter small permease n=1 Tax=Treponema sp. OMZ 840 TaxID=244313 RepID=UPI003D8F1A76